MFGPNGVREPTITAHMDRLIVTGGHALTGVVPIGGAKNSAL